VAGVVRPAEATQERLLAAAMGSPRRRRDGRQHEPDCDPRTVDVIALVAIWAFFAWQEPVFLSAAQPVAAVGGARGDGRAALGMLVVLLPGQIDSRRAAASGSPGRSAAVLVFWHGVPAPLALLIATVGAVLCGRRWAR